jgi:hypothetical protein
MTATTVRLQLLLVISGFLIAACPLRASTLPVPAGLSPGDHYYLLFFTRQTDAVSPDISTYNTIANADADALGWGAVDGVTWHAFVSTTTESVTANVPTSLYPVFTTTYGLPLVQIASDPLSLATGGPSVPLGPYNANVWTGIDPSDLNNLSGGLGASFVTDGNGTSSGIDSIDSGGATPEQQRSFYAISEPLTVPVPEPNAFCLTISLLTIFAFSLRLHKSKLRSRNARCSLALAILTASLSAGVANAEQFRVELPQLEKEIKYGESITVPVDFGLPLVNVKSIEVELSGSQTDGWWVNNGAEGPPWEGPVSGILSATANSTDDFFSQWTQSYNAQGTGAFSATLSLTRIGGGLDATFLADGITDLLLQSEGGFSGGGGGSFVTPPVFTLTTVAMVVTTVPVPEPSTGALAVAVAAGFLLRAARYVRAFTMKVEP